MHCGSRDAEKDTDREAPGGASFRYDGHAVSLWCKSTRGVVADEPQSDSQGLHREV